MSLSDITHCLSCGTALDSSGACPRCGYPLQTPAVSNAPRDPAPAPSGPVGWVCPVCGRGMSPFATQCPCRGWSVPSVTCGTADVIAAFGKG